VLSLLLQMEW